LYGQFTSNIQQRQLWVGFEKYDRLFIVNKVTIR